MIVINTDTNCTVAGFPCPVGQTEFPFHGSIGVLTSGGQTTNFTVGTGDTLMVWNTGAALYPGVEPWEMFLLGVWLVVSVFGLLAVARRFARLLSGGQVREI